MPYSPNSTMGYPQRRWFLEELSQYQNYGMVCAAAPACPRWRRFTQARTVLTLRAHDCGFTQIVWVNTKPWMGPAEEGVDRWPGFAAERQYISDQIVAMGVNNLVSLSGDAHLIAIDSGAHMDYSSSGGAGYVFGVCVCVCVCVSVCVCVCVCECVCVCVCDLYILSSSSYSI